MSNSNNNSKKIVFASILGAILATGLLALNPSMIENAQAELYANEYGYDNNYYHDDNRYSYDDNHQKKSSHTDIQKISCVNSNINVNGIDITQIPEDTTATAAANEQAGPDAANAQNGNGFDKINFNKNLVNICVNVNANEQIRTSTPQRTCEECFEEFLSPDEITTFVELFGVESIERFCILFVNPEDGSVIPEDAFRLALPSVDPEVVDDLIECLEDAGVEFIIG